MISEVLKSILNELRYDLRQNLAVCLEARIGIDFYQPDIVRLVDHKI